MSKHLDREDWTRDRVSAFNTAVHAHAVTTVRYSARLHEHVRQVLDEFDRAFPEPTIGRDPRKGPKENYE